MIQEALNQTPVLEERDGLLIDIETGEICGVVAPDGGHLTDSPDKPAAFIIDDEGKANWVLCKMLKRDAAIHSATIAGADAEAEINARISEALERLENTPEMIELRAIENNCKRIVARNQREREGLRIRFESQLKEWARAYLGSSKVRTVGLPFGTISLRKTGGNLKVDSEANFVEYAKRHGKFDWLKITPLISKVPKDITNLAEVGLVMVPVDDDITINTGLTQPTRGGQ